MSGHDLSSGASCGGPASSAASSRSVAVCYNRFARAGRVHLDVNCRGLERLDEDQRAQLLVHTKARALVSLLQRRDGRRPCRMCALAPALAALFTDPPGSQRVTLALTSVPPERLSVEAQAELSPSGIARLEHLAGVHGWPLHASPFGPIAVGSTTRIAARLACQNLLGLWFPTDLPADPDTVACALALAADRHATGERLFSTPEGAHLWRLAAAVCR